MRKITNLIICISISFVFFHCNSHDENTKANRNEVLKSNILNGKLIVILFDYSSSMDEDGIRQIAKISHDVVKRIPQTSTVRIFSTNNDIFSEPLFKWSNRPPTKPSERKMIEKIRNEKPLEAASKIIELYNEKSKSAESCIINGLKTVYNSLQRNEFRDVKLLVLSDMMECCSGYGCSHTKKNLKSLANNLNSYDINDFQLSKFITLKNIWVAPIKGKEDNNYMVVRNSTGFKTMWDTTFHKMGYPSSPPFNIIVDDFLSSL